MLMFCRIWLSKNNDFERFSKKIQADLIICGATGLNAVERFLIGSVSENIVRSAKCDVLVIRTPEDENKIINKTSCSDYLEQLVFIRLIYLQPRNTHRITRKHYFFVGWYD